MPEGVLNKALRRCRDAMQARSPVIYLKTDSLLFVEQLVFHEKDPLVVLLDRQTRRPIYERKGAYTPKQCLNCHEGFESLPGKDYQYSEQDKLDHVLYPQLWYCNVPENKGESLKKLTQTLERFVADYENPTHHLNKALRSSVFILYSSTVSLSPLLQTYTTIVDVDYPDEEEIRDILKTATNGDPRLVGDEKTLSRYCAALMGLTLEEISVAIRRILSCSSLDRPEEGIKLVTEYKSQKMQQGLLESCSTEASIGGMEDYRAWLDRQIDPLCNSHSYMRRLGIAPPKGVLLCGIPGCGKSEAARFTAKTLGLSLLKMDMGKLMDKYQGESEQKMADALKTAEAMAPCVLWIDELEKGFSDAASSAEGGSGSFKRMFAHMLGWMQDNQKPCFIFATANNIGGLPKEFFRRGRFDALYATFLPTADECASILCARMSAAKKNVARSLQIDESLITLFSPDCFDKAALKEVINEMLVTDDGSPRMVIGSDLQDVVKTALLKLADKEQICGTMWIDALKSVLRDPSFRVYGDGAENVDSIAVSYCRMLRKGFVPTSRNVLFGKEDYHAEKAEAYEKLLKISTASMSGEEKEKHQAALREAEVVPERSWYDQAEKAEAYEKLLKLSTASMSGEEKEKHQAALREAEVVLERSSPFADRYDQAVYTCLRQKMNRFAYQIEKMETNNLITR